MSRTAQYLWPAWWATVACFAIEVLSWNEDVDAAEWKLFGDRRDIKCRELLHMQLGNISTSLCSKMRL